VSSLNPPATPPVPIDAARPQRYGEVFDRGYKHYDGQRLGRLHAIWALTLYSIKRAMGIKKSWTAKVTPFVLYAAIAIPVAVGIGIRAFVDGAEIFDYVGFYSYVFIIQGVFVAGIAPEMLCSDRRENVLALYFSRAITRIDYLVAKLLATAMLTLTVSLVPVLIYWLGVQLLEDSPLRAMADRQDEFWAILLMGTLVALYLGSAGLLVSAFTDRKSIAIGVIIVLFIVTNAIAIVLYEALDGELQRYTVFLSPPNTIIGLGIGLFPDTTEVSEWADTANFPAWAYVAWTLGFSAVATAITYLRYRPNE
jgi:ABC-2 type transport system permease protein